MWHKPCRTFHPWCLCIKTRCLLEALKAVIETEIAMSTILSSLEALKAVIETEIAMSTILSPSGAFLKAVIETEIVMSTILSSLGIDGCHFDSFQWLWWW